MDPLSDVLALLKPRTYVSAALNAGGSWAIQYPAHKGVKFNMLTQGGCWVEVEGGGNPCHLEEGDCFLLTSGRPFALASDLARPRIDAREIYGVGQCMACCNGGGDFYLVGARFEFEGEHVEPLFRNLPAVVPFRASSEQAPVLRWTLDRFGAEVREGRPGGLVMAEQMARVMLVQVLRLYLDTNRGAEQGWLFALADPQLCAALKAMHADLPRRWTLETLSRVAGLSRSAFAERFKSVVGIAPLQYLTGWRMAVAADRLQNTDESVAAVANAVGYESVEAFSTAFRKRMGSAPSLHRHGTVELDEG